MARQRTGRHFVERHNDHWDIRVELPSGERSRRACLPPSVTKDEAKAQAIRVKQAVWAEKGQLAAPQQQRVAEQHGETVQAWGERWWEAREARGMSVKDEKSRWKKWILSAPTESGLAFGDRGIALVTRNDVEDVVTFLDTKIVQGALSWKTAANAWGLLSKAMSDAKDDKNRGLRVRSTNPAIDVRPPERGQRPVKAWLFPSEFLAVMNCDAIPAEVRRSIALNVYLYTRPGELRALTWSDVDMTSKRVSIRKSIMRDGSEKLTTKTSLARKVPIEPALLPLLERMHTNARGHGAVVVLPPDTALSEVLRTALRTAGINRADLFTTDVTRKQITWYDLRATGITWRAIRGDNPMAIRQGAGHKSFSTTEGYIREAETVSDGFELVFPILEAALAEPQKVPEKSTQTYPKPRLSAEMSGSTGTRTAQNSAEKQDERMFSVAETAGIDAPARSTTDGDGHLERALALAAEAGRFDVVARLAEELQARRIASAGNVVALPRKGAR